MLQNCSAIIIFMEQRSLFDEDNIKQTKGSSAQKVSPPAAKAKASESRIYSVSQVNILIKGAIEANLPGRLTVAGEISGYKPHRSGHRYFDLKDENSVIPAVMWKSNVSKLKFEPESGLAVLAKGYVDVYPPQGKYQFYVESMSPAGVGQLQLAFEQMRQRLQAEGLFDEEHKKPLPRYPQRIGILTSESGAAVHDICDSIFNRWPIAELFLYPVSVQGKVAACEIAAAIADINKRNKALGIDLLIVGRGGGSMEDLWAFNEEVLARAIFSSAIPIISAVGHEVDVTIADLVADARVSTPTKAGVIAVPDVEEVMGQIESIGKRLSADVFGRLSYAGQNLETVLASVVFRNPVYMTQNRMQILERLESGMRDSAGNFFNRTYRLLQSYYEKVVSLEPHGLMAKKKVLLARMHSRIKAGAVGVISEGKLRLESAAGKLGGLNPKGVLNRGYSITRNAKDGSLVKCPGDIDVGDMIVTELKDDNLVESKVTKK